MPTQTGEFTDKEQKFMEAYIRTSDRVYAEKQAGLRSRSGYAILSRPACMDFIVKRQRARMAHDALPLAVATVIEVMGNPKAPANARVSAAREVFNQVLGKDETDGAGSSKEPHEMSAEELAEAISKLESVAAGRARQVEPSPGAMAGATEKGGPDQLPAAPPDDVFS